KGYRSFKYQTEYTRNYCKNPVLFEKVREVFETYVEEGQQTLILVGRKDQTGKVLHRFLSELGVKNAYVDGDSDRSYVKKSIQDFNDKKIPALIGSSVIGEGIDIRSTDHLIMLQGGKSEIAITQACGRLVRLYPGKTKGYLHDFRFLNTKYMEK